MLSFRGKTSFIASSAVMIAIAVLISANQLDASDQISVSDTAAENELADLSLTELMNIDVTSVAGVRQEWFQTPAAIYVITNDDIKASGHQTLAELLRVVPGVHVARNSSNTWAISSRGFNSRFANKQLVMIDGRIVYDQFFAGVMWDIQQPMLSDISQIEVIRGPGTTLWGTNAVNGVINVSSYHTRETQGLLFNQVAGIGDIQDKTEVRYGGKLGEDSFYRVYGQFLQFDNTDYTTGESSEDNWSLAKGGFRLDFGKADELNLRIQGEVYGSDRIGTSWNRETFDPNVLLSAKGEDHVGGGHLLARLTKESDQSGWSLQMDVDRVNREIHNLDTQATNFDFDFRHHFRPDARNEIVWGLSVRHTIDQTSDDGEGVQIFFDPADRNSTTYSGFVQETFAIVPEKLFFMIGSKFEHNDFSGVEYEPSARIWWTPNEHHTVWSGVSRSVRVPTRLDAHAVYKLPDDIPIPPVSFGTENLDSETAWTYEVGYRTRAISNVTLDITGYLAHYDDLIGYDPPPGFELAPPGNIGSGEVRGIELAAHWQARNDLLFTGSYTFAQSNIDQFGYRTAIEVPEHMFHLANQWNITKNLTMDSHLYFVDSWFDAVTEVPSYFRLDMGLRWKISDSSELSIWGQNLLDESHVEAGRRDEDVYGGTSEIGRSAYVQYTYRF